MNEHDSLKIASLMRSEGYELTEDPSQADCIILHTCSIRKKPEHKVYSFLGRLKHLKQKRPDLVIGIGGCVAQQEGKRLLERASHLDFVFGTHQIHRVPELVRRSRDKRERFCEVGFAADPPSLHLCPGPAPHQVKAYLTIMQGCDNFCAYCIVPYVRGRERSRPPEEILREARDLARKGVREVTLLGQNVNSYGRGLSGYPTFPQLLEMLHDVEGIWRIRFTTSHPKDLSVELVETMARLPKVCEHLHLPVQSGSTAVLERMRRGYTREEYLERVRLLRRFIPQISLSTDIIVGFPGEEEDDFLQTLSLLEEVQYDGIYSFKFSPRPGTAAARITDTVAEEVKAERLARVQDLQGSITEAILKRSEGAVEEVLVEGPSPKGKGQVTGRTRTNRIVHFPGDPELLKGRLVHVRIVRGLKNSLLGQCVEEGAGM
jgi:tRNA-2-methylthio-N6-dimethylallyladenosine synthase